MEHLGHDDSLAEASRSLKGMLLNLLHLVSGDVLCLLVNHNVRLLVTCSCHAYAFSAVTDFTF